jgi:PAS domain S-box-containing protein
MGISADQIIGRSLIDVLGTKAFEVIRPYIERVLRGERVEFEEEVPISAGSPRFFHVVDEPWFDGEGQVTGWIASVSEITDLKRTTKALGESEERLRLAMSSGTIGVWDWDVSSGQATWSPELWEIFGLEPETARTYEDFSSRVHPDDLAAMESERDAAIRNRIQFDVEFRIIRPSGEIRWLSGRGRGHYDENGNVVRVVGNNIDITERVQAKEALREREQRLRLALDASGGGSWTWDARTGRVDWDDRFRKLYGFTAEEPASADAWPSRVHVEDRSRVLGVLNEILGGMTRNDWENTFRIVRPDGTVAWIESRGRAERDGQGHIVRLTGLDLDVTERRRDEEREAFLLRLTDTIQPLSDPLAIEEVTARLLGEYLQVNRVDYTEIEGTDYIMRVSHVNGVAPIVGRGPMAAFGEWLLEAYRSGEPIVVNDVHTDPRFTESERAHLRAAEIAALAGVMLVKDGHWVATFGVNTATPREWTKPEVELIRNVAERVWEAVERARAEQALREREQRLRLALDASGGGSWTWDTRTGHVDWDERFRQLYGFPAEELPSSEGWLRRLHEDDRQQVFGVLNKILYTKAKNSWDHTFRTVRPDGTELWIESRCQADRDANGDVTRLTGLDMDVTERRRAEEVLQARREEERDRALHREAEEALRRSHAELEQRTLQLRRLASQLTVAEQNARRQLASTLHDGLQQLLFSVGITLDEAMKTKSQDDQVELLQSARTDVKEAVEAARTLSVNLFPPVLHLGGLPAALSWLARRTQEQYGIVVNVAADPQANPEASDVRILLFEAVRELLFNAVKHAGIDRVDVNLALGPDDTIHIQVSDDGVGFDPGATLHDKNQAQAGLGLFSIQERFAMLGGHLEIRSIPGKGSRFTLTLPRNDLPGVAADRTEAQRRDPGWQERLVYDSYNDKSLRILIVDDHAVARAGLRELFGKRPKLQVVGEAASGVEAITQAVALQPDVIVMDVSMPQMNGIDATREIHRTMQHIRIVGLSTHDDESTERLMRRAGAEEYFTKNEGTDRLLDYLHSLLGQAKGASDG